MEPQALSNPFILVFGGLILVVVLYFWNKKNQTSLKSRKNTTFKQRYAQRKRQIKKNGKERLNIPKISEQDITRLETQMDTMNETLPEMTHFVIPGGHTTVSYCHIARCVCRRAERIATLLDEQQGIDPRVLKYLNRLSDYLFVVARKLSYDLKADEVKWIPEKL